MIPIFVISLKSSENRRKNIADQFEKKNIAFEWFDAIEGKKISDTDLNDLVDLEAVKKSPGWLTKGAIGCALSHFYVYKQIVEKHLPYAIVLEDDVVISNDFVPVVEKLIPCLATNEIVLLYATSWQPLELAKRGSIFLTSTYTLYEPVDINQPVTASAYIITHAACVSMIKMILPIRFAADCWGDFYKNHGYKNLHCLFPAIIDTADSKSTIDYLKESRLTALLNSIDKNKIFPFYQLLRLRRKYNKSKMRKVILSDKPSFKNKRYEY
jgi:glycosyl transferase, family 25